MFLHRPEDSSMTRMRHTTRSLVALGFAGVVLLAACGSSGSAKPGSAPSTTAAPSTTVTTAGSTTSASVAPKAGAPDVSVITTPLGLTLVDANGHVLYQDASDPKGASTCTGGCASVWPPLTVPGTTVTVGPNLPAAQFSTITGPGGIHIVADAGHALYRYAGDTKAGQTSGEGIGGFKAAGPVGNTM
jgi:predicted lipoprotein with Yx(FWY)xxD motif